MKKLKKIVIKYFFCGTEEEYEELAGYSTTH